MKKFFSKAIVASIIPLWYILSVFSIIKAEGPSWLDPKSAQYRLLFALSEVSQVALIDLHKNIHSDKSEYTYEKKSGWLLKRFFDELQAINGLQQHACTDEDRKILIRLTGLAILNNSVYTNVSALGNFMGYSSA